VNIIIIILSVFFVSCSAYAYDSWDTTDKYLLALSYMAIMADTITTHKSLNENTHEINPILGDDPSDRKLTLFFVGNVIAITIVAHLFPTYYRKWFLGITSGIKFGSAYWNYRMELRY
jgi:hypothetical protein